MLKWLKSERPKTGPTEDPARLLDAGFAAHGEGDVARAREHYQRVLAIDPRHADALYLLGTLELAGGAPATALERIDAAIAVRADHPAYHYTRGEALRASGRLAEAESAFRRALALDDTDADWWNELGLTLEALGRPDDARDAYRFALDRNAGCVTAACNLANLLTRRDDPQAAIPLLRDALERQPESLPAHLALGLAQAKAGDGAAAVQSFLVADHLARLPGRAEALIDQGITFERLAWRSAAERCYRLATAARPELLAGWINLSTVLMADGRHEDALVAAEQAARLAPETPVARRQHAIALAASGDLSAAEEAAHAAIGLDPAQPQSYYVLGNILAKRGFLDEAENAFRKALELQPQFRDASMALANAMHAAGRYPEAIAVLEGILRDEPDHAEALLNVGVALAQLNRATEAERCLLRAVELKPTLAEALVSLSNLYFALSRLAEGEAAARKAIDIQPENAVAWMNLGTVLQQQGLVAESVDATRKVIALTPHDGFAWNNLLLTLNYLPDVSAEELFAEHLAFGAEFDPDPATVPRFDTIDRRPDRPLRVGYLSPDFRAHVVAFFFEPVLAAHDPKRVETVCYYNHTIVDDTTRRLRQRAQLWRDVAAMNDAELVRLMREDRLDVVVDLAGHTAKSRLTALAQRVAPVQIAWLGYPNTTGLAQMDWRITDARADPPGAEAHHTERLLRLPEVFLCYEPPPEAPEIADPPSASGAPITFGVFNNFPKVTDAMLALWARILERTPNSRLCIKTASLRDEGVLRHLRARMQRAGLDLERIELAGFTPSRREHLAAVANVDIALDTFPYHGTTTTCESLWMGVPVVTLEGDRHASRVGVSLLEHLGLDTLIARSPDEYVSIAVALAADPGRRASMRGTLRERMRHAKLTDVPGFTSQLEEAYRSAFRDTTESR
ncbi:MAG: tetratricopeptide repeat protein [Burkholderiales bacterium]|nr:tetratricopeptide repeat protein [Burkholderiales bacterium]